MICFSLSLSFLFICRIITRFLSFLLYHRLSERLIFFQFYIYNIAYSSMGSNSFIGHFNCSSLNCWIVIVCLLLTPSNVFNHFLRQEFSKMVWLGEQIVFRLAEGPLVHLLIISMTDDTTVGVSRLGIVQVEPALLFSVLISIEFICGSSSFVCLGSE